MGDFRKFLEEIVILTPFASIVPSLPGGPGIRAPLAAAGAPHFGLLLLENVS